MEFELNTPFKNDISFNREEKYDNRPQFFNKRISTFSSNQFINNSNNNNNFYAINKLKNDLKEKPYNNNNFNFVDNNYNIQNDYYINNYNANKNKNKDIKYYLSQINYYIEVIKPFSYDEINIKKLSYDIPLLIYIIFVIFKSFFSKKIKTYHFCLLILLPICAHILINKIIFEEYFYMNIIRTKKILYKNFFKIFFNGYIFFIFGFLTTKFFGTILFRYKYILQIFYLIYAAFIAEKILVEFIIAVSTLINKNNLRSNIKSRDGIKIYFIFFIVYSLISYIINL